MNSFNIQGIGSRMTSALMVQEADTVLLLAKYSLIAVIIILVGAKLIERGRR